MIKPSPHTVRKENPIWFDFKKNPKATARRLQFEALPNEVICHVFSFLKMMDLLTCGQVSKRFRALSNDDQYLWPKRLNLWNKKVPVGLLQKVLDSGCKYLSLSEAILEGTLKLTKASELMYLNLSGFRDSENSEKLEGALFLPKVTAWQYLNRSAFGPECCGNYSEKIIESCYSLKKLSLSKLQLSLKLISIASLQNGKTLKVLDLSNCTFFVENFMRDSGKYEFDCIQQIVENCTELKELSLHMTHLCEKSIDFLVSKLTSNIEKVDLFDQSLLKDIHVKKLVTRCNKITELDLGGWTSITTKSLDYIIENLKLTLMKLSLEFAFLEFDSSDLFKLKNMKKLEILCYNQGSEDWNIFEYVDCKLLKKYLPNLMITPDPGRTRIAIPCHPEYNQRHGFWEINAEQEELFLMKPSLNVKKVMFVGNTRYSNQSIYF